MDTLSVDAFHAILLCRKWQECVAFYRDVLGFKTVDSRTGFIELEVAPGSHIGLIRRAQNGDPQERDFALVLTFRVSDLEKTHETLAARCP